MKKTTALFFVMTLLGCDLVAPPPQRACNRLAKLCELKPEDAKSCSDELTKAAGLIGQERMDKLTSCVKESTSCAEASGCMTGTSIEAVSDQVNNFMKGMNRALDK